ncbi:hypothetical protein [Curtobacterium sp. RRHDQ10]|uniref:hypothetical protein n=1 Tax=Curtobacterium phyllosphaerae TaxID=3413379 RepID=UPI003BF4233F
MGFLDRLLGRDDQQQPTTQDGRGQYGRQPDSQYRYGEQSYQGGASSGPAQSGPRSADEQAVDRYRYLLRTAPPERIEEVHTEAFERLTPEQRRMVFDELSRNAPAGDAPRADDPRSLAQAATRSEIRQPGTMERSLGGLGGGMGAQRQGPGFGSMLGASILGSVAGYVIGSTIMSAFLPDPGSFDGGTDAAGDGGSEGAGSGDTGSDGGASDGGGFDSAGWGDGGGFDQDLGGDFGI